MEMEPLTTVFPHIAAQMRCILSNLYMAASALAPAEAREWNSEVDQRAAMLDQSFYQLLRLVNQLSAAVYLTSDAPLTLRNRDISDMVTEICSAAASLAPLRGLSFTFTDRLGHHACAVAPDEMEQLLYNLLSNAFKFTPAGGAVQVELSRKGEHILLSVTDTGRGIPAPRMETLFDAYAHYDPTQPPPHGLGLGLALCRRFAQGQGGTLLARSTEGAGSVFTLSLPDRVTEEALQDLAVDYSGGFSHPLLGLADALPARAFRLREQ